MRSPDADIRYVLPKLLVERSSGGLREDGYDYVGDPAAPDLLLFLTAADAAAMIPGILRVLTTERVLDNDLSRAPVAIEDGEEFRVVHPADFRGTFPRPGAR